MLSRLLLAAATILPAVAFAGPFDLDRTLREEQSILQALDRHVFDARRAEAAVRAAEGLIAAADVRVRAADDASKRAREACDGARRRLQATLRVLAVSAPYADSVSLVLGGDADEVVRGRALVERIARREAGEVEALGAASLDAEASEFRAGVERANAYATSAAEREAGSRLEAETAARREMLAALERDRTLNARHAAEVDEARRAMVRQIETMLSDRAAPVDFTRLKGKLRWPIAGARIAIPFGDVVHPGFHTVTPHPGLTLAFRGDGRNVRAVAFGRVAFAGEMRGFGQTVVVDHASGYYTVYAGLATIHAFQGDVVHDGTVLGVAERAPGDDEARVYFELRRGTDALDPRPYLGKKD